MKTFLGEGRISVHYNSTDGLYYVPFSDICWNLSRNLMLKELVYWKDNCWIRLSTAQKLYQTYG